MTEATKQHELTPKEREHHQFLLKEFYRLLREGKAQEAEQILKAAEATLKVRGL